MSITSVVNDLVTSVSVINALKPLPPTISGYSVAGKDDLALDPAGGQTVQINGTGFLPGATITFDGSAVSVVTYVNPNQLTFTSPAKTAGTYTIYVVNSDGGTAIYVPGVIYSTLPTWTTAAGSLGSYYETTNISNTVVAAGDAPVTYSLYSGSLPTGSTLSANGVITGTAPVDNSSTTYSFTIQASDAQLQDSTRSFSLTINVDAVTWVSPANNTTYTSAANSAISTVTLSATDAAGYAVSYSANALPTGLSLSGANITGTPTVIADSSTLLTATAATTNRTAVRTINWSITVANDPYFEYNTLLIPGASTTFVDDASTNNFAVSIFGDTKPNNFNPYTPGYYSNYFDGSGDYLAITGIPISATGTFTVECWINTPSINTAAWIYTQRQSISAGRFGIALIPDSTGFHIDVSLGPQASPVSTTNGISYNTWNHIAVVRDSSNNLKIFINGVLDSTTASYTYSIEQSEARIGFLGNSATQYFLGYISNTRVTNTAVYSTTFTPSTTPLTAISGTSLLTCQSNRFIDNSTNNFTITRNGDTKVNSFDPFVPNSSYSSYGSGYFDGTGDYLTAPNNAAFNFGTGNFTVECWVYVISFTGSTNVIISTYQDGSNGWTIGITSNVFYGAAAGDTAEVRSSVTPSVNTWTHLALTRSSTTLSLFVNGVVAATQSNSTNMSTTSAVTIGTNVGGGALNFTGYITDVRVVKGTAVYTTAFTPPSAPLTAIANTSLLTLQNNQSVNNNIFLDNSTNNFLVTRNGNTTQGTFSPYGGNWSNYFDGAGDYLSVPDNAAFALGSSNFTMEVWIYPTATGNYPVIAAQYQNSSNSFFWSLGPTATPRDASFYLYYSGGSTLLSASNAVVLNTWAHHAVVRNSNTLTYYINGVSVATASFSATVNDSSSVITIGNGGETNYTSYPFTGYISNLRIVKGTAVYTSAFTPSTTPLTPIANTVLLTCADNRLVDDSVNNFAITKNGDVSVQRYSPFNPSSVTATSYSGYFDGTGDYLTTPASSILDVGNTSWTIECWVYMNNTTGTQMIVGYNNLSATDFWDLTVVSGVPTFKRRIGGNEVAVSGGTISANVFTNVTVVRNGTAVTLYLNGSSVATNANVSMPTSMSDQILGIGANRYSAGYDYYFNGFISNLRMVKGTAVYTSNFTPPTSPLTAISGTSLLTCQSTTFIDNSTNNFAITAVGNSQPTQQNPFGYVSATTNGYTASTIGGSGYFDGTGDFLTTGTTASNFLCTGSATGITATFEAWVYPTLYNTGGQPWMFASVKAKGVTYSNFGVRNGAVRFYWYDGAAKNVDSASTSDVPLNTWTHICVTINGSTIKIYINGVLNTTSATYTGVQAAGLNSTEYIGQEGNLIYFYGYISDFRLTNTVVYTSAFVPPSAPLTAVQNSSLLLNMTGAGVYDAAMQNNLETVGDARLSTAVSKFGSSSMAFDGTGDRLLSVSSPVNIMGGGDFTIEAWLYPNNTSSAYRALVSSENYPATTGGWSLYQNGTAIEFWLTPGASVTINATSAITASTWQHLALCRASGTLRLFINGTSVASVSNSTSLTGQQIWIGDNNSSSGGLYFYNGYIDDLRITKGYARYTSNFTAPTTAFPIY